MEKENIFVEKFTPLYKKERLVAFYKSQKFADCAFKINGAEVKAHKLILACSSPVFEKMFYGDMASSEISISDIDIEEFEQVLEFIYTEHICISSMINAWSLFYIANKYLLDDLTQVCLNYIQKNLTMNSLVLSYEYAEMYNLQGIKRKCFSDMISYVGGAFCNDYHMKASTLCALLEADVGLDNFELIVHILNWALVECDFRKILAIPEHVIDILREENILKFMKKSWLMNIKCPDCCGSLQVCRCVDELIHESLLLLDKIPLGSEESCSRVKTYRSTPGICRLRKEFKIACRVDLRNDEEYVSSVSANRNMILFGVLVKTEMNPTGIFECGYQGSVTVRVCEVNTRISVAKPTTFKGFIQYDSELYVGFKDLVFLECNLLYNIRVSYKHHGSIVRETPVHCYYMTNKLSNDSKDSVVSFYEMSGTLIKGLSFYAA